MLLFACSQSGAGWRKVRVSKCEGFGEFGIFYGIGGELRTRVNNKIIYVRFQTHANSLARGTFEEIWGLIRFSHLCSRSPTLNESHEEIFGSYQVIMLKKRIFLN